MAECEQCNELKIDASRAEAMKHAGERGHLVHFIVEDSSIYDGRTDSSPYQEKPAGGEPRG